VPHFCLNQSQLGPVFDVWISVSTLRDAALKAANKPVPAPVLVKALIDTGASHTTIDLSLVNQLGLSPGGIVQVITPTTGPIPCDQFTYDVGIYVPLPNGAVWPIPLWIVSAAELLHQGFSVLYGRDLLTQSTLYYDGANGMFTLTF
jgi:hypothetical protein